MPPVEEGVAEAFRTTMLSLTVRLVVLSDVEDPFTVRLPATVRSPEKLPFAADRLEENDANEPEIIPRWSMEATFVPAEFLTSRTLPVGEATPAWSMATGAVVVDVP